MFICHFQNLVDSKYNNQNPNILASTDANSSMFWKGFIWAICAVKMGYRWKVGDGNEIRFWEDTWFRTSPLAVQFWDLYCISNEQVFTISQIWDSENVKLTFRRNFNAKQMEQWFDLEEICKSIIFTPDCDSFIWNYTANGQYSTSSLYSIISFRGVTPTFIPAVWSLVVPPRVHIFLWLLANNKLMTRDNLENRKLGKPSNFEFFQNKKPFLIYSLIALLLT
jgi:hypothetical protein